MVMVVDSVVEEVVCLVAMVVLPPGVLPLVLLGLMTVGWDVPGLGLLLLLFLTAPPPEPTFGPPGSCARCVSSCFFVIIFICSTSMIPWNVSGLM